MMTFQNYKKICNFIQIIFLLKESSHNLLFNVKYCLIWMAKHEQPLYKTWRETKVVYVVDDVDVVVETVANTLTTLSKVNGKVNKMYY